MSACQVLPPVTLSRLRHSLDSIEAISTAIGRASMPAPIAYITTEALLLNGESCTPPCTSTESMLAVRPPLEDLGVAYGLVRWHLGSPGWPGRRARCARVPCAWNWPRPSLTTPAASERAPGCIGCRTSCGRELSMELNASRSCRWAAFTHWTAGSFCVPTQAADSPASSAQQKHMFSSNVHKAKIAQANCLLTFRSDQLCQRCQYGWRARPSLGPSIVLTPGRLSLETSRAHTYEARTRSWCLETRTLLGPQGAAARHPSSPARSGASRPAREPPWIRVRSRCRHPC
jgi:hypothetical protein